MKTIRTIDELRNAVGEYKRRTGGTVGLVPTMGYLHAGHLSLVQEAKRRDGFVVMSIFVNPLQFGPNEDYSRYPRDERRDLGMAGQAGVDAVFLPSVEEMYPEKPVTTVKVSGLTEVLCGASRPGHFDGVATVVSKLLNVVQPDHAYFGMKDAQQLAVITRMAGDLNFPAKIIGCPILREPDGLAMSSRNVFLNEEERQQALILNETLAAAERWVRENPALQVGELREAMTERIHSMPLADPDYVDILSYPDLARTADAMPVDGLQAAHDVILALAVRFGKTRLIDNRILPKKEE